MKNVSFEVQKGSFHAFIGENGAGKSTTIKLIVGLLNVYDGDIFINNKNCKKDNSAREGISFIPDKAIFPTGWTTYQYLMQTGMLCSNNKTEIEEKINKWLESLNIKEISSKNPNRLSAGQKKKVLLIRSIIEKSRIIILDEPAANLDPTTRIQLFTVLKKLSEEGVTIFISSHILDEIKNYANYATFIKNGRIMWSGKVTKNDIIKKYESLYIEDLKGKYEV